ncbi:hypothetical protein WG909_06530 [Peptostreptococcaceae bacterium AGR-M142]
MKKNKFIFVLGIISVLTLGVFSIVQKQDKHINIKNENTRKEESNNEKLKKKDIINKYKKHEVEYIINEMNIIIKNQDLEIGQNPNYILLYIDTLKEKEIDDENLMSILKNEEYEDLTKYIVAQDYIAKNIDKKEEIAEFVSTIISSENINDEIKLLFINSFDLKSEEEIKKEIDQLLKIIENNDEELGFNALKSLYDLDTKKAYEIANEIIDDRKNKSKHQISGALKIKSKYISEFDLDNEEEIKEEFINLCMNYIDNTIDNKKDADENSIRNSSIYALRDLSDKNAIFKIINSENIEESEKVYCLKYNFDVIKNVIENNPSKEDIENVLKANELRPFTDYKKGFDKLIENETDNEVIKKYQKAIKEINEKGRSGNKKYLED